MLRSNQSGHAYLSSNVTYRGETRECPRNFSTARALINRRDEIICPHIGRFRDRDGVFVSRG